METDDGGDGDSGAIARRPQRGSRIRLACSRCQKRKIKCDGQRPTCSGCRRAGAVCSSGNTTRDRPPHRAYVQSLWDRIRWLEAALKEASPGFDLSQAPPVASEQLDDSADPRQVSANPIRPVRLSNTDTQHNQSHQTAASPASDGEQTYPERVHDIGLVSIGAGQDLRYVGPSSGHAFAKLLLKVTGSAAATTRVPVSRKPVPQALLAAQSLRTAPAALPAQLEQAVQLSSVYWETMHPQYPFLHQPTHLKRLEHVYNSPDPKPIYKFQAFIVLAISSTILSHQFKTVLSTEGFLASALLAFEQVQVEGSLEGLQCILLLMVYALVNPSSRLNAWYLSYQGLASVLDLGLQRDVKQDLSLLTREMRTRVFWVAYTLDRTLATALGRPVGLRDEGCELRLPRDLDDAQLLDPNSKLREPGAPPSAITNAIHLMKLAHLNSEIKYIAHSISNQAPAFCYPSVPKITTWQADMQSRLENWASEIPQRCCSMYLTQVATLRYHEIRILLLRPSPAIRSPSADALSACFESANAIIAITHELYRDDVLIYSWTAIHALFLAAITMLYCICAVPHLADEAAQTVDATQAQLQAVSNVLSAAAETWPDAKRSRDVLEDVGASTMRWLRHKANVNLSGQENSFSSSRAILGQPPQRIDRLHTSQQEPGGTIQSGLGFGAIQQQQSIMDHDSFADPFASLFNTEDMSPLDVSSIMQGIFRDYQPVVDLDDGFDLDLLAGCS